jgi:hypothetical protein
MQFHDARLFLGAVLLVIDGDATPEGAVPPPVPFFVCPTSRCSDADVAVEALEVPAEASPDTCRKVQEGYSLCIHKKTFSEMSPQELPTTTYKL